MTILITVKWKTSFDTISDLFDVEKILAILIQTWPLSLGNLLNYVCYLLYEVDIQIQKQN